MANLNAARSSHFASVALALGILTGSASALTQETRLRTTIAASSIEVDVRDAHGNSVTGLTAADFRVTENRQPRPVISVDYLRPQMLPRPGGIPFATPDIASNRDIDATGAVLFLLDDSTPMPASDGPRLIQQVTEAIRRAPTSERIGVLFAAETKLEVPFSGDRSRLISAARRFTARADLGSVVNDFVETEATYGAAFQFDESSETLYRTTIRAMRIAVATLAEQPYRRKALFLFSAGLPLPPGDQPGASPLVRRLIGECQTVIALANDAGISINVIDPGGLRAGFGSVQSRTGSAPGGGIGRLNREFLTSIAAATGGMAAIGTNDPTAVIDRMLGDAGFYLIRFESDSKSPAEVPALITVNTTRGTATIRRRRGVTAAKAAPLSDALVRTTVGVPLDMAMIAVPTAPGRAALIATVKVHRSTKATPTASRRRFTLVVSAYGADGKPAASRTTRINTMLPPSEDDIQFEIVTRLDVATGWYSVRAAIETDEDPKIGSVLGELEIPPSGKSGTTLSGVALTVSPPLMSEPKTALGGLRLPTPTALRVFRRTDRLTAFAFVSKNPKTGASGTDVDFEILTDDGHRVFRDVRHLMPNDFAAGIAQVSFAADLTSLQPGGYWIKVQTAGAAGTTLDRSSRFEVR